MNKKVVFKYAFERSRMIAPYGDVRLVASQGISELPTVWIEVNKNPMLNPEAVYEVRGTGLTFEQNPFDEFCGSCICGPFVWHVYRRLGH